MKALEYELKQRFYISYIDYLKTNIKSIDDFLYINNIVETHPENIRKMIIHKLSSGKLCYVDYNIKNLFSLGCFKYVMGFKRLNDNTPQIDKTAYDYLKNHMTLNNSENVVHCFSKLCDDIESIRQLRNYSAHGGRILNIEDAEYAFNKLIKIKRILINIVKNWK